MITEQMYDNFTQAVTNAFPSVRFNFPKYDNRADGYTFGEEFGRASIQRKDVTVKPYDLVIAFNKDKRLRKVMLHVPLSFTYSREPGLSKRTIESEIDGMFRDKDADHFVVTEVERSAYTEEETLVDAMLFYSYKMYGDYTDYGDSLADMQYIADQVNSCIGNFKRWSDLLLNRLGAFTFE